MLILVDKKMPPMAKQKLSHSGELVELETSGITYDAISGHPDIFFFKGKERFVTAPNLPKMYSDLIGKESRTETITGKFNVGKEYPLSAHYCAVESESYFIHNTTVTDPVIVSLEENKKIINVGQGYCRCSLIALKNDSFITSDQGIYKKLRELKLKVIYISPEEILLPGFQHGFLGGAAGVHEGKLYLAGSLKYLSEGEKLLEFVFETGYEIIELYDGPLFDAGSILFLE